MILINYNYLINKIKELYGGDNLMILINYNYFLVIDI